VSAAFIGIAIFQEPNKTISTELQQLRNQVKESTEQLKMIQSALNDSNATQGNDTTPGLNQ
jgi:chaperonin cofactor prefoldin